MDETTSARTSQDPRESLPDGGDPFHHLSRSIPFGGYRKAKYPGPSTGDGDCKVHQTWVEAIEGLRSSNPCQSS